MLHEILEEEAPGSMPVPGEGGGGREEGGRREGGFIGRYIGDFITCE